MKTVLFILVVVLWVGIKSFNKKLKESADPEDSSNVQTGSQEYARSAVESLFDEETSSDSYSFGENYDFSPSHEGSGYAESGASYVYAESSAEAAPQDTDTSKENIGCDSNAELHETNAEFDLRQAVIYQTILSNKYLAEVRNLDN